MAPLMTLTLIIEWQLYCFVTKVIKVGEVFLDLFLSLIGEWGWAGLINAKSANTMLVFALNWFLL